MLVGDGVVVRQRSLLGSGHPGAMHVDHQAGRMVDPGRGVHQVCAIETTERKRARGIRGRWRVLGAWMAVLIGVALAGLGLGGEPKDDFSIPGTESQRAVEQLAQKLPAFSGAQTQITFAAANGARLTDPAVASAVDR